MQLPVISLTIGGTTVTDVLLDGGSRVNVSTEDESKPIGLPMPVAAPFKLKMVDDKLSQPFGLLGDVKIQIHDIIYTVTFTVIKCEDIKSDYKMLLATIAKTCQSH